MYNEDDAVAKLDGYVISVAGAGRLVGEKHARADREGRPQRGPGLARQPARGRGRERRLGIARRGGAGAAAAAGGAKKPRRSS